MDIRTEIKGYFDIRELVCAHVYSKFGQGAWLFLDDDLLSCLLWVRKGLGKPIVLNNWHRAGKYSQRGLRCNMCQLVHSKTGVYVSAHCLGKAVDFVVLGTTSADVRKWIVSHANEAPAPIRLEDGVDWVHLDVRASGKSNKVTLFKG